MDPSNSPQTPDQLIGEIREQSMQAIYCFMAAGDRLRKAQQLGDLKDVIRDLMLTDIQAALAIKLANDHDQRVASGLTHWQVMDQLFHEDWAPRIVHVTLGGVTTHGD